MAYFRPQTELRQVALDVEHSALLFVDTQIYNCSREGAIYKSYEGKNAHDDASVEYFFSAVADAVPRWQKLLTKSRDAGVQVVFTVIQSLTMDGRDRSLDYKISGFHVPPGSVDAKILPELAPLPNEIVLPKTSSSVFQSTCLDYLLRNMGVRHLLIVGCVTDQCVEHAARDACDLGYLVTLVKDACCTYSAERHAASLAAVAGYCRLRSTDDVIKEIDGCPK
jgi:ureidoacrylate peracid hydrolase